MYIIAEYVCIDMYIIAEVHVVSICMYISETLLGLSFRISPLSFFQVNTPAAEILYSNVKQMCKLHEDVVLLDLCCGTGTIGLCMANDVNKVIGVEFNEQAIEDAKANAQINGITNADFICGKVENVLISVLKAVKETDEVVVVVDPPRAGLHTDVIRAIRKTACISRIVYVACKLSAVSTNIADLTRQTSKRFDGKPFRLMEAMVVDMFPHTELYETVLLIER
ncbi:hypothetical protein HELRODRAFT_187790 [Helobdella robusta]|uniref:tRNA (uracil(54)-C(5))-methyltransferase n=1 Tax=Helobdella robusta TaxID=6412 RepID=T1FPD6_HELRO|nr:hypothetical protein HELRODRAFT_187790 [Helobdella robusta]ESO12077.1 hypothetical protein HELRODRAFT_187790 [Helobdella robusta]